MQNPAPCRYNIYWIIIIDAFVCVFHSNVAAAKCGARYHLHFNGEHEIVTYRVYQQPESAKPIKL